MATFHNIGDTIEAKTAHCNARAWDPVALKRHPVTQEIMYLYRTDKNSHATVISSIDIPSDHNIAAATSHFHREVGDKLTADALSVFVSCKRAIRSKVKEVESHRHGAQLISIPYHTIATIKMPLANMMKKLGLSNNEPNKILE